MSVEIADCLEPDGPISPAWFAGEEIGVEDRIEAAINEALARPEYANIDEDDTFTQDSAVKRWVEYRIYSALGRSSLAMANVTSVTLNDQASWTMGSGAAGASNPYTKSARTALRGWQLLTASADTGTPYRDPPVTVVEDEG